MQATLKFLRTSRGRAIGFAALLLLLAMMYIGLILGFDAVSTDIAFAGTMLPELLEWGYQGIELIAFFASYAFILYALFDQGLRDGALLVGIYVAVAILRFAVLLLMRFIDIWAAIINFLPEIVQLLLIVLICYASVAAFNRVWHVRSQGARTLDVAVSRDSLVYPQKKQPIREDALLRAARGSAVCVSVIRVIGRLIYDITLGPPTDLIDALWMLCYYSVDVLIGVGGYYLIKWMLRMLNGPSVE